MILEESFKIEFTDLDCFTIYYISKNNLETEDEYKILFKYINDILYRRYNYSLHGLYDVTIYCYEGIYVLIFELIDDYGRRDFNVTLFLNSNMLYEFDDFNLINKEKIYLNNKFYVELDNMIDDIRLFEYGRIVYGKEVDFVLNKGVLIT